MDSATKTVYFYKAGDAHFKGVKLPVSLRRYRTVDSLYDDLNDRIPGLSHGVRKLVTSHGRHHVKSVEQLENNTSYIVSDIVNKHRRIPDLQVKSIAHLLHQPHGDVRWSSAPSQIGGPTVKKKKKKRRKRTTSLPPIRPDNDEPTNPDSASETAPKTTKKRRSKRLPVLRSKSIPAPSSAHIDEDLTPLNKRKLRHVQRRRVASKESRSEMQRTFDMGNRRRSSSEQSSMGRRVSDAIKGREWVGGAPQRFNRSPTPEPSPKPAATEPTRRVTPAKQSRRSSTDSNKSKEPDIDFQDGHKRRQSSAGGRNSRVESVISGRSAASHKDDTDRASPTSVDSGTAKSSEHSSKSKDANESWFVDASNDHTKQKLKDRRKSNAKFDVNELAVLPSHMSDSGVSVQNNEDRPQSM